MTACGERVQEIDIAAQDFRFTPNDIRLTASRPARLLIRNEGRERHELAGPLLAPSATLLPGQSLALSIQPLTGTYEIRCLVKGHAGMRAMVIVEE